MDKNVQRMENDLKAINESLQEIIDLMMIKIAHELITTGHNGNDPSEYIKGLLNNMKTIHEESDYRSYRTNLLVHKMHREILGD